jgi:hypothetical protein
MDSEADIAMVALFSISFFRASREIGFVLNGIRKGAKA